MVVKSDKDRVGSDRFGISREAGLFALFNHKGLSLCGFTLLLLILFSANSGFGQATSGSISGFVTDSSGAAVPNAKVTVSNEATGIVTEAVTDNSGFYNVTHIIAGQYGVKVEEPGFKTSLKQHIELQIDSTVRADAQLVLGQASEEVTVTAAAAALKTEKTDVDLVLDQHAIENLPVNSDNLTTLYLVAPGVVPHSFQIGSNENPSEGFMTSVNGQLWMANDYQVDGISDIALGFTGLQIIVPPPDSVQELKVTTATYDPEFGSVGGLVAQYVTKSGGNAFHGSAYWLNRGAWSFAANPFTEKVAGTGPRGTGTGVSPYNETSGACRWGAQSCITNFSFSLTTGSTGGSSAPTSLQRFLMTLSATATSALSRALIPSLTQIPATLMELDARNSQAMLFL